MLADVVYFLHIDAYYIVPIIFIIALIIGILTNKKAKEKIKTIKKARRRKNFYFVLMIIFLICIGLVWCYELIQLKIEEDNRESILKYQSEVTKVGRLSSVLDEAYGFASASSVKRTLVRIPSFVEEYYRSPEIIPSVIYIDSSEEGKEDKIEEAIVDIDGKITEDVIQEYYKKIRDINDQIESNREIYYCSQYENPDTGYRSVLVILKPPMRYTMPNDAERNEEYIQQYLNR